MNEQEKLDLLLKIESTNSKNWSTYSKQDIFKKYQTDKKFLNRVRLAFETQQLIEVENDPLENQILNDEGELLASRDWKCQALNCSYIFCRGNAQKLKIELRSEDSKNLVGTNHVCLKHYYVDGKKRMTVIIILN